MDKDNYNPLRQFVDPNLIGAWTDAFGKLNPSGHGNLRPDGTWYGYV